MRSNSNQNRWRNFQATPRPRLPRRWWATAALWTVLLAIGFLVGGAWIFVQSGRRWAFYAGGALGLLVALQFLLYTWKETR